MDKLCITSGSLFVVADVCAIISLVMPKWLISHVGGNTEIGLLQTCLTIYGRDKECFEVIRPLWVLTFLCVAIGVICITTAIILLAMSYWKCSTMKFARWSGFIAMMVFCVAAVVYPADFEMELIGGKPYQLPGHFQIGLSYICFLLALWITVISELFAGKMCLPHF